MVIALFPHQGNAQTPKYFTSLNTTNSGASHMPYATISYSSGTILGREGAFGDSLKRSEKLFGFRVTRPAKAGYLALLPGLGQLYNHRWWKIPIVYSTIGTFSYILFYNQRAYTEYVHASNKLALDRNLIGNINELGERAGRERSPTGVDNGVYYYRHYRDEFILYVSIVYGLQILDAVVDAELYDFDVSDNLSLNWHPTMLAIPGQAWPIVGLSIILQPK